MINAKRVKDNVQVILNDDFLAADTPSELAPQIPSTDIEECLGDLDLSEFDQLVDKTMKTYKRYDTGMDKYMAKDLHKSLSLTRRQANDINFWAWLGVKHAPDFIAWRWKPKPSGEYNKRNRERFCGDRVRQNFARLWWAVELTRDGNDYTLTEELFGLNGFQDIYEAIFGRAFGNYRPAMAAFVSVVGKKKEVFVRNFAKQLGYALTISVLETMNEDELTNLMSRLVERMENKAA